MINFKKSWVRYLPTTPEALRWGLYVIDAGYTLIPANTPYPPVLHPEDHMFSWERGRSLDSFTLVYITRGGGVFESETGGQSKIEAGNLFIVFPNEHHRYRPDPATGWDEYWVEFDGEQARRIMDHPGFSRKQPVIPLGHNEKVLSLFIEITECIERGSVGFEHLIATQTSQIAARVLTAAQQQSDRPADEIIQHACCRIMEQFDQTIDMNQLARESGMSLSGFRKKFIQATGLPPGKYHQQIRLNKADELLRQTDLLIGDIALQLGFENIYYFSRLFKQKTGCSPSAYRKQRGTAPHSFG
jgi:AraC-like DNA-binding protein